LKQIAAEVNKGIKKTTEQEKHSREVTLAEEKATVNSADTKQEDFTEVFEKRQAELDSYQKKLDDIAADVKKRMAILNAKESELAARELAVIEREQKADAGFADKIKVLADETSRQHLANQAEALRLKELADSLAGDRRSLENEKAEVLKRRQDITAAEQKRDAGFTVERSNLDDELRNKRTKAEAEIANIRENKLSALEDEIAKVKSKRLEDVAKDVQAERDRVRAEIAEERKAWLKEQEDARKQLNIEQMEFEKLRGAVSAQQSEIERRKTELESEERDLERSRERLERQYQKKNDELDAKLESQLEEERETFESEKRSYKAENNRLRDGIRIQTELVGAFEQLKRQLGGKDPAVVIREINGKTDELKRLQGELATRPTEEMRERCKALEAEAERQKARADEFEKQRDIDKEALAEIKSLRLRNSDLEAENKILEQKASRFEDEANEANAKLDRLRAAYERPAEVEARYKEIEIPLIRLDKIQKPVKKADGLDEIPWLDGISDACDNYGIHFNKRILYSFHTALKTAEWSPLTILAGVSGTGKSELPRLYSHFGGLYFEPLSVQPNWDSQESMLGFFNSIDNKFDAQDVLRFLAQSQKEWIEKDNKEVVYPGLSHAVCLVLLDEMNLAHPELYFAEFLSKLELRRGMKGVDVPKLPVKIGAGMPPYELKLGRNVLWAGTMNQDETTKSLSDKVLDRSIIIHFPRPTELKRRLKLEPLDEKNRGQALHKLVWGSWLAQKSAFSEEEVRPFKDFIENMNAALANAGRAIGHRVWQSIEYYMANYPDVRAAKKENDKTKLDAAMHVAFEDQLVQKVMPKLRGIDTRGESQTSCLDKIRAQLNAGIDGNPFNLDEDFELARKLGYGQFIWQTANYIKDDSTTDKPEEDKNDGGGENKPSSNETKK